MSSYNKGDIFSYEFSVVVAKGLDLPKSKWCKLYFDNTSLKIELIDRDFSVDIDKIKRFEI